MTDTLLAHVEVLPAGPQSWPWMLDCFRDQIGRIDGGPAQLASMQTAALARILRSGVGTAVIVAPKGSTEEMGWAVAVNGSLLFLYVRAVFRRQGIGAHLACAITTGAPIGIAYWTQEAEAIAAHGFPLRYSIDAYRTLLSFAREQRTPKKGTHEATGSIL